MGEGQPSAVDSNTLLNEDPFRNQSTQRLFEAIDELRSCGANHDVGLPELVIVGDQSAGKSSLLQSLTDIPFPVADRLCTRFPTRIVSRRTPERSEVTRISIEPSVLDWAGVFVSDENREARAKRLEAYRDFAYSSPNITADGFRQAIDEAKELMDIKRPVSTKEGAPTVGNRNFASDVLKVEISGPNRSYFSILDVPGVFQSLTKGLTAEEKDGVRNMVASYMMPEHSVIICVASGTNDLANQATFDMASKYDPRLQRTIGVITKCDITQHKDQILSLAQNQEKHLDHGWFVVRNRTPPEVASSISSVERHNREKAFFELEPWNKLPEARRGTQALKRYLAGILCRRIQETFPSVLSTIQRRQAVTVDQLGKLGSSRDSVEEKRTYLTELAQQLYSLTSQALRGRYHGLSKESLKLRRFVREANDAFTSKMIDHGHSVPFHTPQVGIHGSSENSKKAGPSQPFATPTNSNFGGFGSSEAKPSGHFVTPQYGTGAFATLAATTHVRSQAPSTRGLEFQGIIENKGTGKSSKVYQTIGVMQDFKDFSFEELRLSDSVQANPSYADPSSGGSFTASTSQPQSSPFDSTSSSEDLFANNSSTSTSSLFSTSTSTPRPSYPTTPAKSATTNKSTSETRQASRIYAWIREEIGNCRGTELQGTLNPDVLPALFNRQIADWKGTATSHFNSVAELTTKVLEQAVHTTCGDGITADNIKRLLLQTARVSEDHGRSLIYQRFNELVTRHLQTQNPIFEINIRDARLARFKAALERYQRRTLSSKADPKTLGPNAANPVIIDLRNITSLFEELHMSNAQNLEDDIHDTLKSYYELALYDFIEFVTQQVVESYLNDPKGPVLFFNPTYVASLSSKAINELGAEDPNIVKERAEKEATLARLQRAEEIALKYSWRF
ncbi:MAG: hypothetical protein Q9184_007384 [Pyrenodesmia sp. 2 TL-2023]